MGKDYYHILGINRNATQDEIKKAFRTLAHQHHPDKAGGNEAKFKEINEAYQVLGDEKKRAQYDQFGAAAFDGAGGFSGGAGSGFTWDFSGFQGGFGFEDLGDVVGDLFGRGAKSRVHRGEDISVDMELTFRESIFGARKDITLTKASACQRCGGGGGEPGSGTRSCQECKGSGVRVNVQRTVFGNVQTKRFCETCLGTGEVPQKSCSTCHGHGVERTRRTFTVTIPPGVEDGAVLRVRGEGEAIKGGRSGDLFVRLHVKQDPRFERQETTLILHTTIGFTQAALGDTIDIETVDGRVELNIPAGTQSGAQFRLRGKGVPYGRGRGDQIVVVDVKTPEKLTREQKKLLEDLDLRT